MKALNLVFCPLRVLVFCRLRVHVLCPLLVYVFCPARVHAAASTTTLAAFPDTSVSAAKTDAAGNIYIAGYRGLGAAAAADAFVVKLSPTGAMLYSVTFAGNNADMAVALDIDSAGAAYVLGATASTDFPVTPGALQATMQGPSGNTQGFAAKIDAAGKVVYATYLGGTSQINLGLSGIVVDAAGDAIVSGQTIGGAFPSTPGAAYTSTDTNAYFVMKLDPACKLLAAVRGVGGRVALDSQGNVYVAGSQFAGAGSTPITPGAFQSTFQLRACGGDAQLAFGCSYQYVTKLNAALTQLVYSTYVDGAYGATPAAISVDAQGNAFLAGTTNSPDYPTTPDAFEPVYIASAPQPPQTCLFFCVFPPPASGFLTKLNSTGTGLIYSTYYSGTQSDSISFAAFTPNAIYLSGSAGSPDLPGLAGFPFQCLPHTYVERMSADGTEAAAVRTTPGNVVAYDAAAGTLLVWTGAALVAIDSAAAPAPIACILDSADLKPVTAIAPGELLSIFGVHLASETDLQPPGKFTTTLGKVTVAINGIASPLLYAAPQQVNLQAPFEIAGAAQANIAFSNTELNLTDSRTLPVVPSNPVAFLAPVVPYSGGPVTACLISGTFYSGGPIPVAFNADGSRNTCANPVAQGSVVRVLLDGLGATSPAQATGAVTPGPGLALNLPIAFAGSVQATVVAATAAPGSISGVWQVDIRMPLNITGAVPVSLTAGGVAVRDSNLTIWVK